MSQKQAPKQAANEADDAPQPDSEWGFKGKKGRRKSRDGRIGILLVLLLLGAFGFVIYNRVEDKHALLAQIRGVFRTSAKVKAKPGHAATPGDAQHSEEKHDPFAVPAQTEPAPHPPANPSDTQAHQQGQRPPKDGEHSQSPWGATEPNASQHASQSAAHNQPPAPNPFQLDAGTAQQVAAQGPHQRNSIADNTASRGPAPAPTGPGATPPAPSPNGWDGHAAAPPNALGATPPAPPPNGLGGTPHAPPSGFGGTPPAPRPNGQGATPPAPPPNGLGASPPAPPPGQDPFANPDQVAHQPPAPSPSQAQDDWNYGRNGGLRNGPPAPPPTESDSNHGRRRQTTAANTTLRNESDPYGASGRAFDTENTPAPSPYEQQDPSLASRPAPRPDVDFTESRPAPRPDGYGNNSRQQGGRFSGNSGGQGFDQIEPAAPIPQGRRNHNPGRGAIDMPANCQTYTVQPLDTYWSISRNVYGTSRYFKALAEFNEAQIPCPTMLMPGMLVRTPTCDVLEQQFPHCIPLAPRPGRPHVPEPCGPPGLFVNGSGPPIYRVGRGDTLSGIALAHLGRSSRWVQIFALNRQVLANGDPNDLVVGTELIMPGDASRVRLVERGEHYR